MTKFIRWQGLVAFIVLSASVAAFTYFFAESLIKAGIVTSAESAFGAEVNVVDVKLSYSPLEISVIGMQVTDKSLPSHNVFSFERATAGVDVWQYLFGKIIIDKLEVSELNIADERAQAGKVYIDEDTVEETQEESASSLLPEMDMQLPDVKTLLNDSNLLTVKASEDLKASYKAEQQKLNALKAQLPSKDKVKYYQDKVKALGKVKVKTLDDIEKISTQYEEIKAEFKADQQLVRQAKQQLLDSKTLLAKQVKALKGAPSKDWQHIEKKYQLESLDGEDFAHILFGEKARGYFQKAQWAYEKIAPFIDNMKNSSEEAEVKVHAAGRFIHFDEEQPLPSVLIKNALFSMNIEQESLQISANEITHQHWIRGKDSILNISSTSNGKIEFVSRFKMTEAGKFISDGNWSVNDRMVSNTELTKSDALSLSIDKAQLNGEGQFTLVGDKILAGNQLSLAQTSYQGNAKTKVTQLLVDTIKSLDKLTIGVEVSGQLDDPDFSINSSLTKALTGAFKQQVSAKVDEFKKKVNSGLNDKLVGALKLGDTEATELIDLEAFLTDTDQAFTDLKNSDVVKQQKEKLKDKLKNKAKDKAKDKLKGKLGDLFG